MQADFVGAGWAFPIRLDQNGGIALVRRERELEEAMHIILSTYPGERPMRPEFGCKLRDYVFQSIDASMMSRLGHEVESALIRWEPRVDVAEVRISRDADRQNALEIDIAYAVKRTNDRRNLVFPFYTIPDDGSEY